MLNLRLVQKIKAFVITFAVLSISTLTGPEIGTSSIIEENGYRFIERMPLLPQSWYFDSTSGIATDSQENIYVVDKENSRVMKYDSSGNIILSWGRPGSANGQFYLPGHITVDKNNMVYVADRLNNRIQKFNQNGDFVLKWGTFGNASGQFDGLSSIASDSNSNIYVADTNNHRIQKFNSNGVFQKSWGAHGDQNGNFIDPSGIAIGPQNNVYVTSDHRIQKFSSNGNFLAKWGDSDSNNSIFNWPLAIAVDNDGNMYINHQNNLVQKFNPSAEFMSTFETSREGAHMYPGQLHIGSAGYFYLTDHRYGRIEKFSLTGDHLTSYKSWSRSEGAFWKPTGVEIGKDGNMYVADLLNRRIQKFDSKGDLLAIWNNYNGNEFQPYAVASDSQSNLYVTDQKSDAVLKFDLQGNFLSKWGESGTDIEQFRAPSGIAVDRQDNIYVSDRYNTRIQKFDSNGSFIKKWGDSAEDGEVISQPVGIAINSDDNVYVASPYEKCVRMFDTEGSYLGKWKTDSKGSDIFEYPIGLSIDNNGNVYVSDQTKIIKLDKSGIVLSKWGSPGFANNQFNNAEGIAVDAALNVYVADTNNHRIQKFSPIPDLTAPKGAISINNGATFTRFSTVNLKISATDNQGMIPFMSLSNDQITWTGWEAFSNARIWSLPAGDGAKHVFVKFKDGNGNISEVFSDSIKLDKTPPTTLFSSNARRVGSFVKGVLPIPVTAGDNLSGILKLRLLIGTREIVVDSKSPYILSTDTTRLSDGSKTFKVIAYDRAGNKAQISRTYIVDNTRPKIQAPSRRVVDRGKYVNLLYYVQDNLSPKAKVSLVIKDKSGSIVNRIRLGYKTTNRLGYYTYKANISLGTYDFYFIASDLAGNKQLNIAKNQFTVNTPYIYSAEQIYALKRTNYWRKAMGFKPVKLDPSLSKAATAHSKFINIHFNNDNAFTDRQLPHREVAGYEGFTGKSPGDRAKYFGYTYKSEYGEQEGGIGEVIVEGMGAGTSKDGKFAYSPESGSLAVDTWMDTLFHFYPFADYRFTKMGFGSAPDLFRSAQTLNPSYDMAVPRPPDRIFRFPFNNAMDVLVAMPFERPQPLEYDWVHGPPIIYHYIEDEDSASLKITSAQLFDSQGNSVPVYHWPRPLPHRHKFAMFSKDILKRAEKYTVVIKGVLKGKAFVDKYSFFTRGYKNTYAIKEKQPTDYSVKISRLGWPKGSDNLIIIPDNGLLHAPIATPLAKKRNAPIITTRTDYIPENVLDEIKRLNPSQIIVLGSSLAKINKRLQNNGFNSELIGISDPFNLASFVAEMIGTNAGREAFVVKANNNRHAIAVMAHAGSKKIPVLYVKHDEIPAQTKAVLKSLNIKKVFLIGTEKTISSGVKKAINGLSIKTDRIAEDYAVNLTYKLAVKFNKAELPNSKIWVLANDPGNLANYLSTGVLASGSGSTILFSERDKISLDLQRFISYRKPTISRAFVIGLESSTSHKIAFPASNIEALN